MSASGFDRRREVALQLLLAVAARPVPDNTTVRPEERPNTTAAEVWKLANAFVAEEVLRESEWNANEAEAKRLCVEADAKREAERESARTPKPSACVEALQAARALLTDESRWTGDNDGSDRGGHCVDPRHEDAVAWSIWGALVKVGTDDSTRAECLRWIGKAIRTSCGIEGSPIEAIDELEEDCTHGDVVAVIASAIALAEEDGAS